jgi:cell division protein FtsZ
MPQVKPEIETFAKIKVIGVGGSGGSAVDRMVKSGIRGVDFWVMNTDVQALHHNSASHKLHIGKTVTRGLGAGMDPDMGKRSAEESQNEIREALKGTDMVFITCGLGGGTGSGASPVIAEIAKEMGALTVAVVTKPFGFEGPQRKKVAEGAYNELAQYVDTIITIPNDRVLQIIDKKTSLMEAFKIVDEVLHQGVQGISELITIPGMINVDFADVKTIMANTGSALMGIGSASGENRAVEAAKAAISSPLLEMSIEGARGILFTITGGIDIGMQEVAEAAEIITSTADPDAKTIFGAVIDESMGDELRITVIATGFDAPDISVLPISTLSSISKNNKEDTSPLRTTAPKRSLFSAPVFERPKREEPVRETIAPMPTPPVTVSPTESFQDTYEDELSEFELPQPLVRVDNTPEPVRKTREFSSRRVSTNTDQSPPVAPKSKPVAQSADSVDKDDLEIPAFIRRKMGM